MTNKDIQGGLTMGEKITKETLEKYGFVKDYEYKEYCAEQEKNDGIERFLLEGQDWEEPVRCFIVQGVWMCLALKAVLSIDRHPLISEYEVRTNVDTIEDIQNAMKCAHIGRVLELKQE